MALAFLFPGQGSQYAGMFKRLPEHPEVKAVFSEAEDFLKSPLERLDSEASLKSTVSVQICLFIAGVAAARVLVAEGIKPAFIAGLSVGSFAAAVVAQSLDFRDGLDLVRARATSMETSFSSGFGMSVEVGLNERQVAQIIVPIYNAGEPLFLSNINAPMQIVVSGSEKALDQFEEQAIKSGARKVERLKVSVPSHCPLLEPTASLLSEKFGRIKMKKPTCRYIGNTRARALSEPQQIAADLANNVSNCVHWYDSLCLMRELGADVFLEMNPGDKLARLCQEVLPDATSLAVEPYSTDYLSRYKNSA